MLFRSCLLRVAAAGALLAGAVAAGRAQAPAITITVPPLVAPGAVADMKAGETELDLTAAQQALELGFITAARELFSDVLKTAGTPAQRGQAALGLASVEIAAERPDDAAAALLQATEAQSARSRLRRGMIALLRKDTAEAVRALENLPADELPADETAWAYFAQGWLAQLQSLAVQQRADEAGRRGQTAESQRFGNEAMAIAQRIVPAYTQAESRVRSEQARTRIRLARERVRLANGLATAESARETRRFLERFPGQSTGFDAAEILAVTLDQLGRKDEARRLLQEQLQLVPNELRATADRLRQTLVLIAGADTPTGLNELRRLLAEAVDASHRRVALELLAGTATNRDAQERFRAELDARIADQPASPVLEDLLLYRARLALVLKDFGRTDEDVRSLLAQFPGSALRIPARFLAVAAAWEQQRPRTAADAVARLLEEPGLGATERGTLTVLQAEAFYNATDYRNAAAAYGAALATGTRPPGTTPGALMFQQVLALSQAERIEETPTALLLSESQALLDRLATDPAFDPVSRWQAEWNLAKTLQVRGRGAQAYERVNRVLAAGGNGVPAELALRLAWLQAKLSLEAGQPRATLTHVEKLLAGVAAPGAVGGEAALREQVAGAAGLLRAQALLELKQVDAALAETGRLRKQYPDSDSAIYSYIILAGYYASAGNQVQAQVELQELVARFAKSPYVPFAMYQLAVSSEQRGLGYYDEAIRRLEELVQKYPRDPLVFYARMRQGDVLRSLNDFGAAQRVYESLLREFPDHHDRPLAELALAHTLYGQWGKDQARLGSAMGRFERLFDSPSAPPDVRIEAGFMLGYLTSLRGNASEAMATYWKVVSRFLLDERAAARLEEKGRDWIARSLFEYARLCEAGKQGEQARRAYELVVLHGLTGKHRARELLAPPAAAGSTGG